MNRDNSFTRKVVYATCIALLLYPLYYLGQPASQGSQGGRLAQIRAEQGIAQSELGDIDPASETMRLATLGLRGVAVTLLWEKANEYKKKKDWENLSATVQQIIKLQPNYISVWEFQGHNLAYNVSVEFDDYRHRYEWVRRGTEFLVQGSQYNRDEPGLIWYIGWVIGQKIGRADEQRQFRRLFRQDEDFHRSMQDEGDVAIDSSDARGPDGRPDNWLVARLWYEKGVSAIRAGRPLRRKSPLIYYSNAYMQRINHATTIEQEGTLDEKAQVAWERAGDEWKRFGDMLIPSTWGHNVQLNELSKLEAERDDLVAQLDALAPDRRSTLYAERYATLTEEEKNGYETPFLRRRGPQFAAAEAAKMKLAISHDELLPAIAEAQKPRAKEIIKRLAELEEVYIAHTRRYRDQVNFGYWLIRCELEQTKTAIEARKHLYDAERRLDEVNPDAARIEYEKAWDKWAELLERFPAVAEDETIANLAEPIGKYIEVLGQLDTKLPDDFKLRDYWNMHLQSRGGAPLPDSPDSPDGPAGETRTPRPSDDSTPPPPAKPAGEKPAGEKPGDEKPAGEKPEEAKPAPAKPTEEKPEEKPAADQSDEKQPSAPADEKPSE